MREGKAIVIVGNEGTGKSTFAEKAALATRKLHGIVYKQYHAGGFEKFPVQEPFLGKNGYKGGLVRVHDDDIDWKPFCRIVSKHFKNGFLIVDDAANYERNDPSEECGELLRMRRHAGIDIFMVFHDMMDVPIRLLARCDRLVLFETSGSFRYKASKLLMADEIEAAQQKVNKLARSSNPHAHTVIKLRR